MSKSQKLSEDLKKMSEKLLVVSRLLNSKKSLKVWIGFSKVSISNSHRKEIVATLAEKHILEAENILLEAREELGICKSEPISTENNSDIVISGEKIIPIYPESSAQPEKEIVVKSQESDKKSCKNSNCSEPRYKASALCYKCFKIQQKKNRDIRNSKKKKAKSKLQSANEPKTYLEKKAEKLGIDLKSIPTEMAVSIYEGSTFIYNALKNCFRGSNDEFYTKEKDPNSDSYLLLLVEYRTDSGVMETVIDIKKALNK